MFTTQNIRVVEIEMDTEERKLLINEITRCKTLHWNFRELQSLPEEVEEYGKKLKNIYLSQNRITKMPTWFTEMENLREINIGYNGLQSLPDDIGRLVNLTKLSAPGNRLKLIPSSLYDLKRLIVLNLSHNGISFISKDIAKNVDLEILSMDKNRLKSIPEEIIKCTKLWDLSLNNNFLTHLPLGLTWMPKLKYIAVQNNKLQCLPALPFLSKFKKILYEGNNDTLKKIPIMAQYMDGALPISRFGNQLQTHMCNFMDDEEYPCVVVQFNEDGTYETELPVQRTLYDLSLNAVRFKIDKVKKIHRDPVYYQYQRKLMAESILEDLIRPPTFCYCGCGELLYHRAVVCIFPTDFVTPRYRPHHITPNQKYIAYYHHKHYSTLRPSNIFDQWFPTGGS